MAGERPLIISIVGTRPEAIKMAPVARALKRRRGLDHLLLLTGQHPGLERWFERTDSRLRALPYDPRGRSAKALRQSLQALLCAHLRLEPVELVLVQGDTASAYAGALAARRCGIAVGHVEAGLRSFDLRQPHPEEGHRIAIDSVSELLFAPTETAAENLRRDRRVGGRIRVTGNTGIDALLEMRSRLEHRSSVDSDRRRLIVATCHRRENQGRAALAVYETLKRLV
ncbi:MAG TPA: UDP-N-acetylglucosamine 2-epimerase, partial [Allosphingosinicella sp.]|nr:UDP-N-acetylglucosamine 2-epimerase [Allosphingosinicella sp.]